MTIICYRDGMMAADSGSCADGVYQSTLSKIVRIPSGGLAAAAGRSPETYEFRQWILEKQDPLKFQIDVDEGAFGALVVLPGGFVWRLTHDGKSHPVYAEFFAEGACHIFALGAMAAGASAEKAVRLSIEYTDCARGPIEVETLPVRADGR